MIENERRRPAQRRAADARRGARTADRATATARGGQDEVPADPAAAAEDCRNDALRLLALRERTRRGLVTALVHRRHDRITAAAVVEQLAHSGWVDDLRYARLRLQQAVRTRPESLRALTLRLRQEGCDDETIRAAMKETKDGVDGFDDLELARRLVRKKLRTSGRDREQILRALVRRGFPPDIVRQALREAESGPD